MNARTRDSGARTAMWVQLVDVLAQDRGAWQAELRADAYQWLETWRSSVPESRRAATATAIGGCALPIDLVDFFARDVASVATPVIARTKLDDEAWAERLSTWPQSTRAILADRNDLPELLARALDALGPHRLALPDAGSLQTVPESAESLAPAPAAFPDLPDAPEIIAAAPMEDEILELSIESRVDTATEIAGLDEAPGTSVQPIGALLDRIERYRRDNPARRAAAATSQSESERGFAYETDRAGLITWVEGVAGRGALVGLSIADMALPGEAGVDGQAAGAFRKRAPFEHARLFVEGRSSIAGNWLISGAPVFEPDSGRFLGYQGLARRLVEATPATEATGELLGGALRPASVRQLVHELRTPLNAIRGFAEMIESELWGPVEHPYRARAAQIMRESHALLRVFEDLDSAARLEAGDYESPGSARTSLRILARDVFEKAEPMARDRELSLRVTLSEELLETRVDDVSARRLLDGFVDLLAGVAVAGEDIIVSLGTHSGAALLEARPGAAGMRGPWTWSATVVDEPGGYADILPLGLGYKFRLLSRLAERVGGALNAAGDRLSLLLPLADATAEQSVSG